MRSLLALSLALLFPCGLALGQNLVSNPSFEDTSSCPTGPIQLYKAPPWFQPTWGNPDYFNSCYTPIAQSVDVPDNFFGYQYAKTGDAYAGFIIGNAPEGGGHYIEYIEAELLDSLSAGKEYCVSFYVSLGDSSRYASDDIEAYFSNDSITDATVYNFPFIAQVSNPSSNFITDKLNWVLVSGQFTAAGGEKFITIGCFNDSLNTDLIPVPSGGDSLSYGFAYYYIDDISVIPCDSLNAIGSNQYSDEFLIYPNPITHEVTVENLSNKTFTIKIVDIAGRNLILKAIERHSQATIDMSMFTPGMYILQRHNDSPITNHKIIKKR